MFVNSISDKPTKSSSCRLPHMAAGEDEANADRHLRGSSNEDRVLKDTDGGIGPEDEGNTDRGQQRPNTGDKVSEDTSDGAGPDTSSFSAFIASFFSSDRKAGEESKKSRIESEPEFVPIFNHDQNLTENKSSLQVTIPYTSQGDEGMPAVVDLPEMSDPSKLLSDRTRTFLYTSLPTLAKGRKWVLLYSTWKHGISLSTLYRRSSLYSGLSVLVVGDLKGPVFGGLVESPLTAKSKKYQGTNSTFLFSDGPGHPEIYRPTGVNRYFTLCSPKHIAMGGGQHHFALYLDDDLQRGSSYASETYGNPCLASAQEFVVKEVELWAFVYASKYEEMLALCREDAPGISRW